MDNQQPVIEDTEEFKTTARDKVAWIVQRGFALIGVGIAIYLSKGSSSLVVIVTTALGGGVGGGLGYLFAEPIKKKRK